MTILEIFSWLEHNSLGVAARTVPWVFPTLESLHFIGVCVLIGAIAIVDLRLLGLGRTTPLMAIQPLVPISIIGFALALSSGIGFFSSSPGDYWGNLGFRVKLVLLCLGGLNAAWFKVMEQPRLSSGAAGMDTPLSTKLVAGLSLLIWALVLILGRLLPYLPGASRG